MTKVNSLQLQTILYSRTDKNIRIGRIYPEETDVNFLIRQSFTHYDGPRSGIAYKTKFWRPRADDVAYFQANEELYYFSCMESILPVDFAPFVMVKITPEFKQKLDKYLEYTSKIWAPILYHHGHVVRQDKTYETPENIEKIKKEFYENRDQIDPEHFDFPESCFVGWINGEDLFYYNMERL